MKGSVSDCVRRLVDNSPNVKQMLSLDLLNCANYAETIHPQIEKTIGRDTGRNSIVMALRRYADELKETGESVSEVPKLEYQIVMHTRILDFNLAKSETLLRKISEFYQLLPNRQREFINFVVGTNEVGVVASDHYREEIQRMVNSERVLHQEDDLVAFTMVFTGPFMQTPGIIHEAVQRFAWQDINLLELVSTMNELTFIVKSSDSLSAYQILQGFQA